MASWLYTGLLMLILGFSVESHSSYNYYSYPQTASVLISDSYINVRASYGLIAYYSRSNTTQAFGTLYDARRTIACETLTEKRRVTSNTSMPARPFVALLKRDDAGCSDLDQVRKAESLGASAVVFYTSASDPVKLSSYYTNDGFPILVVLISLPDVDITRLENAIDLNNATILISVNSINDFGGTRTFYFVVFAFSVLVFLSLTWFLVTFIRRIHHYFANRCRRTRAQRATTRALAQIPTRKHKSNNDDRTNNEDDDTTSLNSQDGPSCAVCLESFKRSETIRTLPCSHEFHKKCIDPWLKTNGTCPLCKHNIISKNAPAGRNPRVVPLTPQSTSSESTDDSGTINETLSIV